MRPRILFVDDHEDTRNLELVAKLTFQVAMRDDGTSQQHECFMRGAARLLAHPQLPELV